MIYISYDVSTFQIRPPFVTQVTSLYLQNETLDTISKIATLLGASSVRLSTDIRKTMDFAHELKQVKKKILFLDN